LLLHFCHQNYWNINKLCRTWFANYYVQIKQKNSYHYKSIQILISKLINHSYKCIIHMIILYSTIKACTFHNKLSGKIRAWDIYYFWNDKLFSQKVRSITDGNVACWTGRNLGCKCYVFVFDTNWLRTRHQLHFKYLRTLQRVTWDIVIRRIEYFGRI